MLYFLYKISANVMHSIFTWYVTNIRSIEVSKFKAPLCIILVSHVHNVITKLLAVCELLINFCKVLYELVATV